MFLSHVLCDYLNNSKNVKQGKGVTVLDHGFQEETVMVLQIVDEDPPSYTFDIDYKGSIPHCQQ
jgi:hypothetical protein